MVLVFGLAAGVFLVRNQNIFRLGASAEFAPKDVRVSNVTDNSATISWVTDRQTSGFVKWGDEQGSLDKTELDELTSQSLTHTLTIRQLTPETIYYFKINSGGEDFDNSQIPWQITTGPALDTPLKTNLVSGSVLSSSGAPAKNSLVYITVGGGSPLSTITSEEGNWVIPVSNARNQDLTGFIIIDEKNSLIEISVNAGLDGVASAQIYPQSAKPTPTIILGQVHDFKNLEPSEVSDIPKASIGLPDEATPSSGFEVEEKTTAPAAKTVTLESVKEGEIVTTTEPEFFGEGPAGTTITITVESEVVTDTLKIPSSGDWNWSPPAGLAAGAHTITIVWRDASGVLRTLKRTFVVQASEGPAFESTPSASPTSTPKPSSSPTPSPTPTKTASATATPAISPTPTSTISGIPVPGSLTPTILLSIMGIGVIAFSILIWKKADA